MSLSNELSLNTLLDSCCINLAVLVLNNNLRLYRLLLCRFCLFSCLCSFCCLCCCLLNSVLNLSGLLSNLLSCLFNSLLNLLGCLLYGFFYLSL